MGFTMAKSAVKNTEKKADELFAIGKITGCFGIKGYLKVLPLTHSLERFDALEVVRLGLSDTVTFEQTIEDVRYQSKGVFIKFAGVDDRTASEKYVGNYVFIGNDELIAPPKGSWFIHDIIGCEVFHNNGTKLGVVKDVWKMASSDLWEIAYGDTSIMFPATKDFIERVDVKKHQITVNPPDGLFEL